MESPTYKIDLFEGPLDLLISLIEKNKINISDIPISLICDQYMQYLAAAESLNMELSSDFIVMASTLMLIKSKMLLPKISDDEEDPRAVLAAAVIEYKRAKQASVILEKNFEIYSERFIKDSDEIKPESSDIEPHDVSLLAQALKRVMSQIKINDIDSREKISPLIETKPTSVTDKIYSLIYSLYREGDMSAEEYFLKAKSKDELSAMFMAVLELLRSGRVFIKFNDNSNDDFGVIEISENIKLCLNFKHNSKQLSKAEDS